MRAVLQRNDLAVARRIYHRQILPAFDVLRQSANPTGTLKAGLNLHGIQVGVPRRPGRPLDGAPLRALEKHLHELPRLESLTDAAFA
jgi:4-hydroxy-tetrahydrodipicolinate synthase